MLKLICLGLLVAFASTATLVGDSLQDESEALNENVIEVKGLEESMERAGIPLQDATQPETLEENLEPSDRSGCRDHYSSYKCYGRWGWYCPGVSYKPYKIRWWNFMARHCRRTCCDKFSATRSLGYCRRCSSAGGSSGRRPPTHPRAG